VIWLQGTNRDLASKPAAGSTISSTAWPKPPAAESRPALDHYGVSESVAKLRNEPGIAARAPVDRETPESGPAPRSYPTTLNC
jgi:hypothetical protein